MWHRGEEGGAEPNVRAEADFMHRGVTTFVGYLREAVALAAVTTAKTAGPPQNSRRVCTEGL